MKPTLNQADIELLTDLIDNRLEVKLDEKFDEKLKFLPSKEEFYTKMAEVMDELQTARQNSDINTYKISDHDDRLEIIETKLAITI